MAVSSGLQPAKMANNLAGDERFRQKLSFRLRRLLPKIEKALPKMNRTMSGIHSPNDLEGMRTHLRPTAGSDFRNSGGHRSDQIAAIGRRCGESQSAGLTQRNPIGGLANDRQFQFENSANRSSRTPRHSILRSAALDPSGFSTKLNFNVLGIFRFHQFSKLLTA